MNSPHPSGRHHESLLGLSSSILSIGRVGVLALTLGMGAVVVGLPAVAFADTTGSEGASGVIIEFGEEPRGTESEDRFGAEDTAANNAAFEFGGGSSDSAAAGRVRSGTTAPTGSDSDTLDEAVAWAAAGAARQDELRNRPKSVAPPSAAPAKDIGSASSMPIAAAVSSPNRCLVVRQWNS